MRLNIGDVCLENLEEAFEAERRRMKKSQRLVSLFILLAFLVVGVSAQTQKQTSIINDRRVGAILQQLERSSTRFRNSLNVILIRVRIYQTRTENDINTFEPDLEQAINEFKDRFARNLANTTDVQSVLQKAALINGFMARNRLSQSVQTEWVSVRNDLSALATAYGVSWQWNRQQSPLINSPRVTRLTESDLNQLIRRIEVGVKTLSASIGVAFDQSRYDRKRSEGSMNVEWDKVTLYRNRNIIDATDPLLKTKNNTAEEKQYVYERKKMVRKLRVTSSQLPVTGNR